MSNISPFEIVVSERCAIYCSQEFYTWMRDNIKSTAAEGMKGQWGVVELHITESKE
jgi:hypothetical protein